MQSVPITTKVVCWNLTQGEVSSIKLNPIKFVSDLGQVCGFLKVLWFPTKLTGTICKHPNHVSIV